MGFGDPITICRIDCRYVREELRLPRLGGL